MRRTLLLLMLAAGGGALASDWNTWANCVEQCAQTRHCVPASTKTRSPWRKGASAREHACVVGCSRDCHPDGGTPVAVTAEREMPR